MNRRFRWASAGIAGAVALACSASSQAATTLSIDLNNFAVNVSTVGTVKTLTLSRDSNTRIADVSIDDISMGGAAVVSIFSGSIVINTLTNAITAGSFTLTSALGGTYSVSGMTGAVTQTPGPSGNTVIEASTTGGNFTPDGSFSGVDLSALGIGGREPLSGEFFQFALNNSAYNAVNGFDANVNAEITAIVPTPAALPAGAALLVGVGLARRYFTFA